MIHRNPQDEQGVTLTELTVVTVLAVVVMLGLTGFYLTSQFTWIDGSARAVSQREGTFAIETIRDSARTAYAYDLLGNQLSLFKVGETNTAFYVFRWDPSTSDSILLAGPPGAERKLIDSRVRRFDLSFVDSGMVELTALELVSATGQPVTFHSRFALLNHQGAP